MALQIRGAAPAAPIMPIVPGTRPSKAARSVRALIRDIARIHRQAGDFAWHALGAHLQYRRLLPDAQGNPVLACIDIVVDPALDPDSRSVTHVVRLASLGPDRGSEQIVAAGRMDILGIRPAR